MGITLGADQYGKAENRLVRIYRDTPRHEIRDVTVSTALRGDFAAAYLHGDQAQVLPTDTQKNTVYAFAKEHGLHAIEEYALTLARHFVDDVEPVHGARIAVDEFAWDRVPVGPEGHDHTWVRRGQDVRTTVVDVSDTGTEVVSGLRDLVLLKSTGSEFAGFLKDGYTTLAETNDRIMSTALVAQWRYTADGRGLGQGVGRRPAHHAGAVRDRALPRPAADAVGDGARRCWRRTRRSGRSTCRPRTSTTSSSTSPRSGWRTPTRSSTPPTARTA